MNALERLVSHADRLSQEVSDGVVAHLRAQALSALRDLERAIFRRWGDYRAGVALESQRSYQEFRARAAAAELRVLIASLDLAQASNQGVLLQSLLRAQQIGIREAEMYLRHFQAGPVGFYAVDDQAARMALENSVQRLKNYSQEAQRRISDTIAQNLLSGKGARETARAIRENAIAPLLSRAETIAQTEIQSARLERRDAVYQGEGIEYVQWVATADDDRVCSVCGPRHGLVFRREDVPRVPHARCRCTRIPWRKEWYQQGLTNDQLWIEQRAAIRRELEARGESWRLRSGPFEKRDGLERPPRPIARPTNQ